MRLAVLAGVLLLGACAVPQAEESSSRTGNVETANLESSYGNYLAGQFARKHGNMKTAAQFFARAVAEDPQSMYLLHDALVAALIRGDFPAAHSLATRIHAKNPGRGLANLFLGVAALKQHRPQDALAYLKAVQPVGVDSLTVPMLVAWSEAGAGDTAAALAALQPLAGVPAFDPLRHFHAALIEDLAGDTAKADADYQATITSGGESAEVVNAYGNFLERHGHKDKARALFQTFLASQSQNPGIQAALKLTGVPVTPKPVVPSAAAGAAEALYGIAAITEANAGLGVGILYLRLAIYLKPDLTFAHLLLADTYESAGDWRHAIAAYRGIPVDSPYRWSAELRIAWGLDQLRETDKAVALLRKLIKEEPQRTEALSTLGDILRGEHKYKQAVAAYSEAITRTKPLTSGDWSLFYVRGIAYERSHEWPKAQTDFLKALQLNPNQPYVLNYLGYSWVIRGINLNEAQRMIERAVALAPDDGAIVDSLGWAYYHLHEYQRAVHELERAASLSPEDPTINDHLGDAYWRVGRHAEARYQWQRVLTLKPEPKEIPILKRKIAVGLGENAGLDRRRAARVVQAGS